MTAYVVQKALTVDTSAYADGDVVGGLITFGTGEFPEGAILNGVTLVDDDNEKKLMNLFLFSAAPSSIADNAAFAPTVADLKKLFKRVTFAAADYTSYNSNAIIFSDDLNTVLPLNNGMLWAYLVAGAAVTFTAAADLHLNFLVLAEPRGK
jgi:hypothetical protein